MLTTQSVPTRGLSSAAPLAGVAPRLGALAAAGLKRLCEAVALRWRIRRDRRHLLELDEYLLEDVGLTRTELHRQLKHRPYVGPRYY